MANFLEGNLARMQNARQNVSDAARIRGEGQDRLRGSIRNVGDVFAKLRGEKLAQDEAEAQRGFTAGENMLDRQLEIQLDEDTRRDDARNRNAARDFTQHVTYPHEFEIAKQQAQYAMERAQLASGRDVEKGPTENEVFKAALELVYSSMEPSWQNEDGSIKWTENAEKAQTIFDSYIDRELRDGRINEESARALKAEFADYIKETLSPDLQQEDGGGRAGRGPWMDDRGLPTRGLAGNLLRRMERTGTPSLLENEPLNLLNPPGDQSTPVEPLPEDASQGETPYRTDQPPISVQGDEVQLWDELQKLLNGDQANQARQYMDQLYEPGEMSEQELEPIIRYLSENSEDEGGFLKKIFGFFGGN